MIKHILFDLDGTLHYLDENRVGMDLLKRFEDYFVMHDRKYKGITVRIYEGIQAMRANNGKETNKDVFLKYLYRFYSYPKEMPALFDNFYENEFDKLEYLHKTYEGANKLIDDLYNQGYKLYIISNPILPVLAHKKRLIWSGIDPNKFVYFSGTENSSYCKENVKFYEEIINKLNINPQEAIMVGNNVSKDLKAKEVGMNTYLMTYNIINDENKDLSNQDMGTFEDFLKYLKDINK